MPMHNGWIPREGITSDPVGRFIKKTALNPFFPLLFILAARHTKKGSDLSILHHTAYTRIQTLFYLGLVRWLSGYFDTGLLNNWSKDVYDWEKEIVLITGGAGGIGGYVVRLLAERSIKVVVMDVIPMTFDAPNNVFYYKCDITSPSLIATTATQIRKDVGKPTIIINNAGVVRGKDILDATEKDVRFTFDVNTLAHYWMAKEFVPSMVRRNHGMIVTVASLAAYVTAPNMTDYAASKAASLSFHEGLTAELKTRYSAPKVRTVVVNQGYTKTPLFQGFNNDNSFLVPSLEPETVAEAIVNQVLTGRSGQVIIPGFGSVFTFFRGMPHWFQLRTRNNLAKGMKDWQGRQVIDVEKWKVGEREGEEKDNGESASTVLVPEE
ncbi:T-toxin biosynthesis RED2 [Hyphodiscus hymeniophilus]|uniref:Short-chain dehydrogenase/reductase 3 n=1 Tax=Hyphodiscus hymeniophilus TaxID=353542 RepID=A0A9P7AZ36_9HELO|nr:T-toxin biosynthesis RED2 [Hyphodiscus hymeniophilus]